MKHPRSVHAWLQLVFISLVGLLVFSVPLETLLAQSSSARWEQVGLTDDNVTGVVVPARNGNVAYAATRGFRHVIFRTGNLGNTWDPKNAGLDVLDFRFLLLGDPQSDDLVYAVGDLTLWKTLDRGESWAGVRLPWPTRFDSRCTQALYRVAANRVLYAAMYQVWSGPFFCQYSKLWLTKSLDTGRSWSDVSAAPRAPRSAVAVAPSNQAVVYGADGDQVFWTQDGGQSWKPRASVGRSYAIRTLTVHPQDPNIAYATTEKNGVYRTSNAGQSCDSLNQTLPTQGEDLRCPALAIHPTRPEMVIMACNTYGVFWSTDSGDTWMSRNEGFNPFLQINSLAIAPIGTQASLYLTQWWLNQAYPFSMYLPFVVKSEPPPVPPFVVYLATEEGVWRLIGP